MSNATVTITGSTYEIRNYLRAAGGVWDARAKTWTLAADAWAALVAEYGHGTNKRDRARAAAFAGCVAEEAS